MKTQNILSKQAFVISKQAFIMSKQAFKISKQTQDRVKLAKKYILEKYQRLLLNEKNQSENRQKIINLMKKNYLPIKQKIEIQEKLNKQQQIQNRLRRQKDSLKNYQILQLIGKGAFGDVCLAKDKTTNQIFAIKRMQKKRLASRKQIASPYLEKQLMIKNKQSQFLVNLHSTFQDKKHLFIVMQYISGGDLLHLLIEKDIFTQEQTKFYIAQLIVAVQQIHSKNYIHRDIKPDNILIKKDGHIKISDFGLSKYLDKIHLYRSQTQSSQKTPLAKKKVRKCVSITKNMLNKLNLAQSKSIRKFSKVGTPDYISPQVLTCDEYDFSIDIWSIGIIMFQCLFGYPPFSDQNSHQVCQKVVNWQQYFVFPHHISITQNAKDLLNGMVNIKENRLSIKKIKKHPFFKGIQWDKLLTYKPPVVPFLQTEIDTRNFEKYEFTQKWESLSDHQQDNQQKWKNWKQNTKQSFTSNYHQRKRSSSVNFGFAGFDYKQTNFSPLKQIQQMINFRKIPKNQNDIPKKQSLNKILLNKKYKQKRLNTETISSYLLTKPNAKSNQRIKSRMFSPVNNISLKMNQTAKSFMKSPQSKMLMAQSLRNKLKKITSPAKLNLQRKSRNSTNTKQV